MCEYCKINEDGKDINKPLIGETKFEKFLLHAGVSKDMGLEIFVYNGGGGTEVLKKEINYCPMCGRKL